MQRGQQGSASRRVLPGLFIAFALAFSSAVAWAALGFREPAVLEHQVSFRPVQVKGDGYVSSQTCRACHPSQYGTWRDSYHRTMTQVATPEAVRADFDGLMIPAMPGASSMRVERRGRDFWAEFEDPDRDRAQAASPRIKRQVVMVTGSHHQQVYWYRTDRSRILGQLPMMYLIAERRWIPRRSAFLTPPSGPHRSETGRWNSTCLNCHSTHGKPRIDMKGGSADSEPIANTTTAELGIGCEACHGPAEEHVRQNRSFPRRYMLHLTGRNDPTIVEPRRVNPRFSSQICGQCHGVWELNDEASRQALNTAGFPYRPGDDLTRTRLIVQPSHEPVLARGSTSNSSDFAAVVAEASTHFWSDGMIRVSGREYNGLIASPCFKDATDDKRRMSCFSCHAMHKTPDDPRTAHEWADTHQVASGMNGNAACLQCHPSIRSNLTQHTKHQSDSTGSLCYNCHMPYTTYGLLNALRSHQISSPSVSATVQTGRPNACNLCHLDKTLQWTSDHLERWYRIPVVPLEPEQRSTAASLLWLLRGDAGQRALAAWSLGWQPAQLTAGTSWMPAYLAILLDDPYDAVRFVAARSLRTMPAFADFPYDFVGPSANRVKDGLRAMEVWRRTRTQVRTDSALLLDDDGWLDVDAVTLMLAKRDNRPITLAE